MELSEEQKCLIGGLELLKMEKDNIIMVCLMLRSEQQVMDMLEWLAQQLEQDKNPSQPEVMDKAQEIMNVPTYKTVFINSLDDSDNNP